LVVGHGKRAVAWWCEKLPLDRASEDVPEGVDGELVRLELESAAPAAAREEDGFAGDDRSRA